MTKIAAITDVHSDRVTLDRALEQIADLGVDLVLCAGDAVDMNLLPGSDETIERLKEARALCVRGNHERWVLERGDLEHRLSQPSIAWLRALEPSWSRTIDGVRVALWHARPGSDMDAIDEDELVDGDVEGLLWEAEADLLIVGHLHEPAVLRAEVGVILRPGALGAETVEAPWLLDRATGQFVQGAPKPGTFALVDLPGLEVELHEVER